MLPTISNTLFSNSNFIIHPHQFCITMHFLNFDQKKQLKLDTGVSNLILIQNSHSKISKLNFFVISNFCSAQLITFYFNYLVQQNIIFRKAVLVLVSTLILKINSFKVIYSKFGLKKLKLKGFKLKLSGRFENSKNQMSKKLEQTVGVLSLLSLNSYIEFFDLNICSKLGTCSFKI